MKRSASVTHSVLSAVAAMALSAGCGSPYRYQQVCADANGNVVDQQRCQDESQRWNQYVHIHHNGLGYLPLYHWYYPPYGARYAVGSRLAPNTPTAVPASSGGRVAYASPTVRGGFGESAGHAVGE